MRHAAATIDSWPVDRRFTIVRQSLRTQLLAQATVIDQRAADAVDGQSTYASRASLRTLERRLDAASIDSARAQRAAGLITRAAFDALVDDLQ